MTTPRRKPAKTDPRDARIAALEAECGRLRHEITVGDTVAPLCSDEPANVEVLSSLKPVRIYIVWTVGLYPNGVRLLDLRGVTFSMAHAKTWSRMLRRDKEPGDRWERVVIEPRVANHLYGEKLREMLVNTGRM